MSHPDCTCPNDRAYAVEFRALHADLTELKERVKSVETTLARGLALLVANLVGVIITLAQQLAQ